MQRRSVAGMGGLEPDTQGLLLGICAAQTQCFDFPRLISIIYSTDSTAYCKVSASKTLKRCLCWGAGYGFPCHFDTRLGHGGIGTFN